MDKKQFLAKTSCNWIYSMYLIYPVIFEVIWCLEVVKLTVFISRIYNGSSWENKPWVELNHEAWVKPCDDPPRWFTDPQGQKGESSGHHQSQWKAALEEHYPSKCWAYFHATSFNHFILKIVQYYCHMHKTRTIRWCFQFRSSNSSFNLSSQ